MMIREMQRETDCKNLLEFDTSFSTEYVYQVSIKGMSVEITEEKLSHPLCKTYQFDFIKKEIAEAEFAVVAEIQEKIVGFATAKYEQWNNRTVLTGIFVKPTVKRNGIGRALIDAIADYAKTKSARCLFVETQNINYSAIQFYRKMNFEFCGFDTELYNFADVFPREIAFYFCKNLSNENT